MLHKIKLSWNWKYICLVLHKFLDVNLEKNLKNIIMQDCWADTA